MLPFWDLTYSEIFPQQEINISNGDPPQTAANGDAGLSPKEQVAAIKEKLKGDLTYSIDEIPPWYNAILLGFQVSLC